MATPIIKDKDGNRIKHRQGAKKMVLTPEFRGHTERNRRVYHRPSINRISAQDY